MDDENRVKDDRQTKQQHFINVEHHQWRSRQRQHGVVALSGKNQDTQKQTDAVSRAAHRQKGVVKTLADNVERCFASLPSGHIASVAAYICCLMANNML